MLTLENKILLNAEYRRANNNNNNNENLPNSGLPVDCGVKIKESENRDVSRLCLTTKKTLEYDGDGNTNCNWCARNSRQSIGIGTGRLRNKRTNGDHPNYSIVDIGQNTEKSPGDL